MMRPGEDPEPDYVAFVDRGAGAWRLKIVKGPGGDESVPLAFEQAGEVFDWLRDADHAAPRDILAFTDEGEEIRRYHVGTRGDLDFSGVGQ